MVKVLVYISLGSNLGDRAQHLNNAKNAIHQNIGKIISESSIYETEAVGFKGNAFYNQVIKIETALLPESLLQKTQEIEKKLGRKQKTIIKNGTPVYLNRIIDIDILLYGDLQINTNELTVPHPRMLERDFVMKPLNEVRL
jgi:2-amino-4-hydroxy-6-hydroxymethyldihydropteridine diphosphokinase